MHTIIRQWTSLRSRSNGVCPTWTLFEGTHSPCPPRSTWLFLTLSSLFNSELGWDETKVDELLLPIIRKMSKRSQVRCFIICKPRFYKFMLNL